MRSRFSAQHGAHSTEDDVCSVVARPRVRVVELRQGRSEEEVRSDNAGPGEDNEAGEVGWSGPSQGARR